MSRLPRSKRAELAAAAELAPVDWHERVGAALQQKTGVADAEALRLLALTGADLSASTTHGTGEEALRTTAGETLAWQCAAHGRVSVLHRLAEQGVNLLAAHPNNGMTTASFAAQDGQFEALRCVVEHAGPEALREQE